MWNGFKKNWIVIRFALILERIAYNPNFSHFWALKYVGNVIGLNLFEPEPDQNQGPVQGSGIWLNRTLGPVHGSQKSCENRTDPNRGITSIPAHLKPNSDVFFLAGSSDLTAPSQSDTYSLISKGEKGDPGC